VLPVNAGHDVRKPTQKIIEEISDEYAFLVRVLDMSP
jgi:prolyl oligopeptidase PreP (S9A serine peptidase family)